MRIDKIIDNTIGIWGALFANKKALSYESYFGIPVDSNLSKCHPGLIYLYHMFKQVSSVDSIQNTLAWTGRDSNPYLLGDNQTDCHYPTGPNPAREVSVYHEHR